MPKVIVNLSNRPKGEVITIPGLGGFPNGKATEIDEKKYKRFCKSTGWAGDNLLVGKALKSKPKTKTDANKEPETETDVTQEESSD